MKKYKVLNILSLILACLTAALLLFLFIKDMDWYLILAVGAVLGLFVGYLLTSLIYYKDIKDSAYQKQRLELWNSISYRVKNAGETSFNEMPLGIILFNDEFVIEWANNYAKKIFESELVQRNFSNLNQEFANMISKRDAEFDIKIYDKYYHCIHMLRDHVLYLTDITDSTKLLNRYKDRTLTLGILNLDNLDLTMSTIDAQEKSLQMSRIIGLLTDWADENNLCIKGYSDERYILIMDSVTLDGVIKRGFGILASIKNYCEKEGLRITASIGIVCADKNAVELMKDAEEQLDLALSRGGNQAIVKRNDEVLYFGARTEAFESRTAPIIRAKTEELLYLIKKHKNIYIMAHANMDADAFGACLIASKMVQSTGHKPFIIFDEKSIDATVREIYNSISNSNASTKDVLISSADAIKKISDSDLLIVVDCQYSRLVMSDRVLKKAKHIAIIDHHRRNPDALSEYEFIYSQPSGSSSVELLAEMLDFVDRDKFDISPSEATWMIMGIIVDTNNFMFHTTFRTFNVLAKLQVYGAEMGKVQKYLREDYKEYSKKIDLLQNLEIINGVYGVVTCDDEIYDRAFIAKIADNIISVGNVKASFCIGKFSKNEINISARSLDEENVQVIMEKFNGGGHFTTAAAQLKDISLSEAREKLIQVLSKTESKEDEVVKVILKKDVKGRGKANSVIDVTMGYAVNYLYKNDLAIEATSENLKNLEAENLKRAQEEDKKLHEMQELKAKIDSLNVKIAVKVGTSGKLFGSVTTKEVVEEFKNQNGIELDKKNILYDKAIDALGTYKLPIKLYKDVTATITLFVIEGGTK